MINEALQWAVLLAMAVFVFGLTRQLGHFLISNRAERSAAHGPTLGRVVPRSIVRREERERLNQLMRDRGTSWAAVAAVSEHCVGCRALVEELHAHGVPESAPLMLLADGVSDDYMTKVSSLADITVNGDGRFQAAGIGMTPFVFLVDHDLRVVHKLGAGTVTNAFNEWRSKAVKEMTLEVVAAGGSRESAVTELAER